ncbi:MAG: hypothetical protein WCG95_04315 [bacterium]
MKDKIKVTEEMQLVVEQMRLDDIEENPDIENEFFDCDCCGQCKCVAGSIQYGDYRLCNDCVLFAEVGFELKKLNSIQDLVDAMEDKRLEEICGFIKNDSNGVNN